MMVIGAWSNFSVWLSGEAAERVTWSLVHFLWQGLLIAVTYAAVHRLARSVPARSAR